MNAPASRDDLGREETIFNAAVQFRDPAKRAMYLDLACEGDPELRARIEKLLSSDAGDYFFEQPLAKPLLLNAAAPGQEGRPNLASVMAASLTEQPGDMIGRYKLREQIGEGGCGVVYMAEQEEPVRRRVALKIIKLGMDTRSVIARFEAEHQALALLDHPNIAKVLDAGATDTGRPYFVMELVGGIKITDYCEQNNLTIRQRLDLFIQVCRAIQHAHQKGIIHRDIKPSNVLVATQDGIAVPKVIDFGIAKATQGRLADQTVFTAFEQFLGTPAYMSPEQAQLGGLDVDTRSDIYSLGVLLYELLTGKTPFDAKDLLAAGLEAMRRTIQEKEPPTPSTRLKQDTAVRAASSDKSALRSPQSALDRDLDWIVMKCLEKDRARRYETANGLASDIQRHLNDEPVAAGPPGTIYRLGKFARRNKAAVITTVAIIVVLVLGIVASTLEARQQMLLRQQAQAAQRAVEREREKALKAAAKSEQVARLLKETLEGVGPSKALGRDTTMLKEILDRTAERVSNELTNQPGVEMQLRDVLAETYRELGLYKKMEEMARECVRLARSDAGEETQDYALSLRLLGESLRRLGDYKQAEALLREALARLRKLLGKEHHDAVETLADLAFVLADQGKSGEAESTLREVLQLRRQTLGNEHLDVANVLHSLASVLRLRLKMVEAESSSREALAIFRKLLGNEHPDVASSLNGLAEALAGQGKLTEAEAAFREVLAMRRKLLGKEHLDVANSLEGLAGVLDGQRKQVEAEAFYRDALAIEEKLLGAEHPSIAVSLNKLANNLAEQGKFAEAEALHREALAMRRKLLGDDHPGVANSLNSLASLLCKQLKLVEAEPLARESVATATKVFGKDDPRVAIALGTLISILRSAGKLEEAEALCRQNVTKVRARLAPDDPVLATELERFSMILVMESKFTEAEPMIRECLAIREKKLPDDWRTYNTRCLLGRAFLGQTNYVAAEPLLVSGYEGLKQREATMLAPYKPFLKEALLSLVQLSEATGQTNQMVEWKGKLGEFERAQANKQPPDSSPAKPTL